MSGIGPCLIFLFLAPIIFVALIAFDSAKKRKPEQDNSSICDNTRATEGTVNSFAQISSDILAEV